MVNITMPINQATTINNSIITLVSSFISFLSAFVPIRMHPTLSIKERIFIMRLILKKHNLADFIRYNGWGTSLWEQKTYHLVSRSIFSRNHTLCEMMLIQALSQWSCDFLYRYSVKIRPTLQQQFRVTIICDGSEFIEPPILISGDSITVRPHRDTNQFSHLRLW